MKKSNIILISLFVLGLIFVVALQMYIRSLAMGKQKVAIEVFPDLITSVKLESGWNVEIETGDSSRITFSDEKIKDLIEIDGGLLILNEANIDSIKNFDIKIKTKKLYQISMSGNSKLNYYSTYIDSLTVNLLDKSTLTIQDAIHEDEGNLTNDKGIINYVSAVLSDNSKLVIYQTINSLHAELKDSCHCRFTGNVQIDKLSKSKYAIIRTW